MRGEHSCTRQTVLSLTGSSPHARGALALKTGAHTIAGIIPACAGSTGPEDGRAYDRGDHPRMRGEHSCTRQTVLSLTGSSPHARGARFDTFCAGVS